MWETTTKNKQSPKFTIKKKSKKKKKGRRATYSSYWTKPAQEIKRLKKIKYKMEVATSQKKGGGGQPPRKKKKRRATYWTSCTWAFSLFTYQIPPHPVFSPFWGENFLVGPRRKHSGLTIILPSLPSNQTFSKKNFSSFSLSFLFFFFRPLFNLE